MRGRSTTRLSGSPLPLADPDRARPREASRPDLADPRALLLEERLTTETDTAATAMEEVPTEAEAAAAADQLLLHVAPLAGTRVEMQAARPEEDAADSLPEVLPAAELEEVVTQEDREVIVDAAADLPEEEEETVGAMEVETTVDTVAETMAQEAEEEETMEDTVVVEEDMAAADTVVAETVTEAEATVVEETADTEVTAGAADTVVEEGEDSEVAEAVVVIVEAVEETEEGQWEEEEGEGEEEMDPVHPERERSN